MIFTIDNNDDNFKLTLIIIKIYHISSLVFDFPYVKGHSVIKMKISMILFKEYGTATEELLRR